MSDFELLKREIENLDDLQLLSFINVLSNLGYVYIIECPALKIIKIGITKREKRVHEIMSSFPFPAQLIALIETHYPRSLELFLHEKFAIFERGHEWFNMKGDDVVKFLKYNNLLDHPGEHEIQLCSKCRECGKSFHFTFNSTSNRKWCSNSCKMKAYRARKRSNLL